MTLQEKDLYPPLKTYLIKQGYEVKGEVNHCDIVATRGDSEIVVVELKLSLNLTILLQAVDRLKLTDIVYIGVPKGLPSLRKQRKRVVKLVRMLGLGLITIDCHARVGRIDVLCDPGDYKPRQIKKHQHRLLVEFEQRAGDPNPGGSRPRRGLLTAYRQKALALAEYLDHNGETKAAMIAKELEEPKSRTILYNNVYGWFDRLGKGVYKLSPRGQQELPEWRARNSK